MYWHFTFALTLGTYSLEVQTPKHNSNFKLLVSVQTDTH